MNKLLFSFLVIVFMGCSFTALSTDNKQQAKTEDPKLVVFISVDQMRYDYFGRFGKFFKKGLKQLWDKGTVYENTFHMHTPTNTAPGHASLSTGMFPGHHGVISNSFFNRNTLTSGYCVEDLEINIVGVENDGTIPGRSPKNLQVTALGDWLKASNSKSKVCSVSKKDRAAILLGGKNPDYAFWLDEVSTKFVSSDYYELEYPNWADKFVGKVVMKDFLEEGWHKKETDDVYKREAREDDFEQEMGSFASTFPHTKERMTMGFPDARKNAVMLTTTPMADEMVLKFSKLVLDKTKLGKDNNVDILFIGCSAADYIGHHFGPYSQEVMDYYLYLDEYLEDLFKHLDKKVGKDNYWVVLSADHGVVPLPEESARRGRDARRIQFRELTFELNRIQNAVKKVFGLIYPIFLNISGGLYLDYAESDSKGISRAELNLAVVDSLRKVEFIEDAYAREELEGTVVREDIQMFRNSHHVERSHDIVYRFKRYYLLSGTKGTGHGSTYSYDYHVPLIFMGPPFESRKIERIVRTVDIAPTIATLLKIKTPENLDGRPLVEIITNKKVSGSEQ